MRLDLKNTAGKEVTQEMRDKYSRGEYVMQVPPVCCARWTIDDWCRWVTFTKGKDNGSKEESSAKA